MLARLKRLVLYLTIALGALAVLDQLRRPTEQRTWHGAVLGVPYDFRPPTLRRFLSAWWNPDDPRLFTPRDFGVGWAVNLHRLLEIVSDPARRNGDG